MGPKEKVACYVRVSTQSQTKEDKYSIPEQIDILENICKSNKWESVFYKDLGISAESMLARPEFLKMLKECEDGNYKSVLVVDQDRLSRNVADLQKIKEIFINQKIKLVTQNSTMDFTNEDDDFISDINGVLSKREIRVFAKRSARGKYQKAKQGKIPTSGYNIPYGYKLDENDRMVINEEEASVIREIFESIAKKGLSCYKVADRLNALGIPTRSKEFGKKLKSRIHDKRYDPIWTRSTVHHIVRKDHYYKEDYLVCRDSKYNHIKPVIIKKKSIISKDLFEKARVQLSKNKSFHNNKATVVYILTGKMRCMKCGHAYVGGRWRSKTGLYYYYRDLGKKRKGYNYKCNGASIKRDLIEGVIKEDVRGYLTHPETVIKYLDSFNSKKQSIDFDNRIKSKMDEIDRLLELYSKDIPEEIKESNVVQLLSRKQKELEELKRLKSETGYKEEVKKIRKDTFNNLSKILKEISKGISNLNEWDWKAITDKLIEKIEVDSIGGLGKTEKLDVYVTYNFNKVLENTCQWTDKTGSLSTDKCNSMDKDTCQWTDYR